MFTEAATVDVTGIGNDRFLALNTRILRSNIVVPDPGNIEPHMPVDNGRHAYRSGANTEPKACSFNSELQLTLLTQLPATCVLTYSETIILPSVYQQVP